MIALTLAARVARAALTEARVGVFASVKVDPPCVVDVPQAVAVKGVVIKPSSRMFFNCPQIVLCLASTAVVYKAFPAPVPTAAMTPGEIPDRPCLAFNSASCSGL